MSKTAREVIAEHAYSNSSIAESNVDGLIAALDAAGFVIVKKVGSGEAARPGFDMRSYEVGYIEGESSGSADVESTVENLVDALEEIASMPRTPSDELASATNIADSALSTYRAKVQP